MKRKIAIVVQRYGLEINGGAEYHARLIAEMLAKFFAVEVFTTTALDYVTWAHHYEEGLERVNGIPVHRFRAARPRDPRLFGAIQHVVFEEEHSFADELRWLEEEGPLVPNLLQALELRCQEFGYILFFSYRYYHAYHGVKAFPRQSILVPTAEHDPAIHMRLFRDLFRLPRAIVYNSHEERQLINRISANESVPGDVVGVGSEIPPEVSPEPARLAFGLNENYFVYVGRLDENKGVPELLAFYLRMLEENPRLPSLVLAGKSYIRLPDHPRIRHLGFVTDEEKFSLIAGSDFLAIPSQFESLSMVALEAWALGKPVLANGRTDVLQGQCRRSHAGLWYTDFEEFREVVNLLVSDESLRRNLGESGKQFFQTNYTWPVIEKKYMTLLSFLDEIKTP